MSTLVAEWVQTEARVRIQQDAGAGHQWLELIVPDDFQAPRPGQFVQLLIQAPSPVLLPRPMSVASVRERAQGRTLGFLYAPIGAGTRALTRLREGETVGILGPLGRGYPLERAGAPVLVAGGRGVAPLIFAAQELARPGSGEAPRRSEFVFGARDAQHLVGLNEARRELEAVGGHLHVCTDDGSRGLKGNVIAALDALEGQLEESPVIHACGPHGMLKAVAHWALARGVPAFLAMESVMACGTGVCRGCPLPRSAARRASFDASTTPSLWGNREYAMCCTEGPIFEGGDLDWAQVE